LVLSWEPDTADRLKLGLRDPLEKNSANNL